MHPYCITEKRVLRQDERDFLQHILEKYSPDRLAQIDDIVVVARCGCGSCPGILFGADFDDPPVTSRGSQPIVDINFPDAVNGQIGVVIWATDSKISELELIGYGDHNITTLPPISELGESVAA